MQVRTLHCKILAKFPFMQTTPMRDLAAAQVLRTPVCMQLWYNSTYGPHHQLS